MNRPAREDNVLDQALRIAASMVNGTVTPHAGATAIWVLSVESDGVCFDELRGFIAAASQYDEAPGHREELASDALAAARDLLAQHGV